MNNLKKTWKYIIINFLIFTALFFAFDYFIYFIHAKNFVPNKTAGNKPPSFGYKLKPYVNIACIDNFFNGESNLTSGRFPDGLEYKSKPIILFGCSFAFGAHLEKDQTFSHKLSEILKRPVYNRAVSGQSFQEMYYQIKQNIFYKQVPKSDTVIYIMMFDHYRRTYVYTTDILSKSFLVHYDVKKPKRLVLEKYSNPITNLLKILYISKMINTKYYHHFVNSPKNSEKVTDDALLYFIKTRNLLEQRWNNKINFIVIFYGDNILYSDLLREKLENYDFKVLETKELTDVDLDTPEYKIENDGHPNEKAWNLLTPLIAEKISEMEE